jgi:hypothetical protein
MANKLHPESFQQAFHSGESMVLLFHHAEHCWFHATELEPVMPDVIDADFGRLRDFVSRLQKIFPSRARPRLCGKLIERLNKAQQQYGSARGSEAHRGAIIAFNEDNFETTSDPYPDLVRQAPVFGEAWDRLKESSIAFVEKLPPILRSLANVGDLVSKGLWWNRSYSDPIQDRQGSHLQFLAVRLNGQLSSELRELRRRLRAIRGITCDLYCSAYQDAIARLEVFRTQILTTMLSRS